MAISHKSKRITWASDLNLCQIKLFLSEESPSQVGIKTQDHIKKTPLWPVQSGYDGTNDNLPPGFEGIHQRLNLPKIPLTKWRCPPRIEIYSEWQVVAGDESYEIKNENQRLTRVLEAIYPWPSAIPPNPSVLADVENSTANDQNTPLVPVTPIEGEQDASSLGTTVLSSSPDKKMPMESLIDTDLLLKILSNPKIVQQLMTSNGGPANNTNMPLHNTHNNMPYCSLQITPNRNIASTTTTTTTPQYIPNSFDSTKIAYNRIDHPITANGPFYPCPQFRTVLTPSSAAPVEKDINYYKNLIQQHGGERRDVLPQYVPQNNQPMMINQEPFNCLMPQYVPQKNQPMMINQEPFNCLMKSRESAKPNLKRKPCVYFNSPRGCKNGANCTYQHDTTSYQQRFNCFAAEVPIAKRVKLDREISGV